MSSTQISKYKQTNKLVEIVKKCRVLELNDEAIINTIELETGKLISRKQLQELTAMALREVRENKIEVDVHMDHMIKVGLYQDAMNHHEMLSVLERVIYSEILEEAVKKGDEKNRNLMLAMSNTLTKVFAAKDNNITNIAFLTKTKAIWEQGKNDSGTDEPKAAIMIKNQKEDINKLIDQSIDKRELENNRVF